MPTLYNETYKYVPISEKIAQEQRKSVQIKKSDQGIYQNYVKENVPNNFQK